ncbi:class I SAM-dependent methyltransferase [Streptomyces sp. NPDC058000]|uniref:class I SAM-dependent methyltransferase n=1 Tax=Streptomyces sp. NPDC058000 TaxID=3346299 RepID=UPI0036E6F7BC
MHTQSGTPVPAALGPALPPPLLDRLPTPPYLPGLESTTPIREADSWLRDAVLGPFSGDIVEYLRLARNTGGPILDLGSGAGRLAVPFARHGFPVTAVDRDRPGLRRLHAWAADLGPQVARLVTTVRADLERLRLRDHYQLAVLAGAMVTAVSPRARPALLHEVAAHLGAGGALALDYTEHEPAGLLAHPRRTWAFEVPRVDGVTEWVVARQVFDPDTGREHLTYQCERTEKSRVRRSVLTTDKWVVDRGRLTAELAAAGLRIADRRCRRLDARTRSVLLVCHTAT